MATAFFHLGVFAGTCVLDLVYDTVTLAVSAVQMINPVSNFTMTLTRPNGQSRTIQMPVSATTKQFALPNNFLTLTTDPVDGSVCIPNGWSCSVLS